MSETAVSHEEIVDIIVGHARDILALEPNAIGPEDSLRDIGANSIDRADIIMSTLESLSVDIPLVELANARNINELAEIIHANS